MTLGPFPAEDDPGWGPWVQKSCLVVAGMDREVIGAAMVPCRGEGRVVMAPRVGGKRVDPRKLMRR